MPRSVEQMHLLMFAANCYPPQAAEAIVNAKLVHAMLGAGWRVDVITRSNSGQIYPGTSNSWSGVAQACHALHAGVGHGASNVLRKIRGTIRSGHLTMGLTWVDAAIGKAAELCRRNAYDCILSRSTPIYGHLPALTLARRLGIPWIANWNDPDPMEKYPPPYGGGPGARISSFTQRYLSDVANRADWHTFTTERLRRYNSSYLGGRTVDHSSVIPHVAMRQHAHARETRNEKMIFCHAGNLGTERDPKSLLEAMRLFLDQYPHRRSDVRLQFIGLTDSRTGSLASAMGLGDLVSIDAARGYEDTMGVLAGADVLLIVEAPMTDGIFLPSKFVDYVQLGKPILAVSPAVGTIPDLIGTNGGGIAADCGSPEAIAAAIARLYDVWKNGSLQADFGSGRLYTLFSEERVLGMYSELIGTIARKSRSKADARLA
jgi:glycosyltransferase involved in cell wall biosynthesis